MGHRSSFSYSSDSSSSEHYCQACEREFSSLFSLNAHLAQSSRHSYCFDCDRDFINDNALRNHLASSIHQPKNIKCPRCSSGFVSASALTKHVEAGRCVSVTNKQIVECVRRWESVSGHENLLTVPRLGWKYSGLDEIKGSSVITSKVYATEASFDGEDYVCPICSRCFRLLGSLNQHLNSNVHEASEFRCITCRKTFRELSALVAHVESRVCGGMSTKKIQKYTTLIHKFGTLAITDR